LSPSANSEVVSIIEATRLAAIDNATKGPLVMVVDDEKVIADTLSIILARNGYTVLTAYNANSALELADAAPPNLLITDVVMPGMNGIDLAIEISQSFPSCKILLFSGQAATVDLLDAARKLGHEFNTLSKPVHPTELLARLSESLLMSATA
jgi:CheY-like chemotaxis protein